MSAVDLIAVQPRMTLADYGTAAAYRAHHRALAERAAALVAAAGPGPGGTTPPVLAVWPEMVGTFLSVQDRLEVVGDATTTDQALQRIALRMLPRLLTTMARHRTRSTTRAFLTATAATTWTTHWSTFAAIAAENHWWVVAGTALLPVNAKGIDTVEFAPLPGEPGSRVYNTGLTFDPQGHCVAVTRKVNLVPTQEDVLDLSPGDPDDLPVVETDFGPLGTLVCYDGFAEAHTSEEPGWVRCGPRLDAAGAVVVAQPSANAWAWDAPWFFNDEAAGEHQLRREQWFAEGFFAELGGFTSIRYCVNPQLVGELLDNSFEAPSLILGRTDAAQVEILAQSDDPRGEDVLHVRVEI